MAATYSPALRGRTHFRCRAEEVIDIDIAVFIMHGYGNARPIASSSGLQAFGGFSLVNALTATPERTHP